MPTPPVPSLDDHPDFLTIPEAAAVLRIGRNAAYELAALWRHTDGREGLPVVNLGRTLRVPKHALLQMKQTPQTPTEPVL